MRGSDNGEGRATLQTGFANGKARRRARARAMCSSARVGVGEGTEACISINFGRLGALLGSSVAFGSGCG